ncbi:MAG: glycosyltransferase [Solobacterium sp.]|nr:glycosyltransferase [Solobacterium sp.]
MPEVSVIVPIYNVVDYLPKCIDSILSQTYTDYELILVDDGSTDDSPSLCEFYREKDARIKVIHKPNGGLSDARNEGMKIATGTFLSFIDSDDFVEPELLERCVSCFHEMDADMVIFDYYQYYQSTGTKEVIRNPFSNERVYSLAKDPELLIRIANAAWNKMYRRSLFLKHGITYPWGCLYEDLGTTYRLLARADRVAFINEPLYDYLKDRPGNITGEFNMRAYHILDMVKITLDDYKNLGIYDTYYEELKYLAGINILECLKKTRTCTDTALVNEYIDVCFWYLKQNWPEFPKCRYPICREKYDWIYAHAWTLKQYLKWKQGRRKQEL